MKTLSTPRYFVAAAALTTLLGVTASAMAQGMPAPMHPPRTSEAAVADQAPGGRSERHAQHEQRMQQWRTERLNQLKAALKLAPEQEAAWNSFVSQTAPPARPPMPAIEEGSQLTTPQRLDRMLAMKKERDAHLVRRVEATKNFYASLRPEQQKIFDTQDQRAHRGWSGMKGEHPMHHPG